MAVHCAGDGSANGWSDRATFWLIYAITLGISGLIWGSTQFAIGPSARINLPNREYWTAPERRDQTVAYLRRWFLWFGAVLTGVLVSTFELVLRANLRPVVHLDNKVFHQLFVPFLLFTGIWTVSLLLHFRLPRGARP